MRPPKLYNVMRTKLLFAGWAMIITSTSACLLHADLIKGHRDVEHIPFVLNPAFMGDYTYFTSPKWLKLNAYEKACALNKISHDLLAGALENRVIDLKEIVAAGMPIHIKLLATLRDVFIKHLGPDLFLYSLFSCTHLHELHPINAEMMGEEFWEKNRARHNELVMFALVHGANVNFNARGQTLLELARMYGAYSLALFLYRSGAKVSTPNVDAYVSAGVEHVFNNPALALELQYRSLNAPASTDPKIPYLLHHVWFTHPDHPHEMSDADIKNVLANHTLFAQDPQATWDHVVWTNDPNLIPNSVHRLEGAGIQVRSIESIKNDLMLYNRILAYIDSEHWGIASDIARFSLVELIGGVYADLNFKFERTTTDEAHRYHFFAPEYPGLTRILFSRFGAKAHHPILQRALELIEENIQHPPLSIATMAYPNSVEGINTKTFATTSLVLGLAYYAKAHQDGNIDVVYPYSTDACTHRSYDSGPYKSPYTTDAYFGPVTEAYATTWGEEARCCDFLEYIADENISGDCKIYLGTDNFSSEGTWIPKH